MNKFIKSTSSIKLFELEPSALVAKALATETKNPSALADERSEAARLKNPSASSTKSPSPYLSRQGRGEEGEPSASISCLTSPSTGEVDYRSGEGDLLSNSSLSDLANISSYTLTQPLPSRERGRKESFSIAGERSEAARRRNDSISSISDLSNIRYFRQSPSERKIFLRPYFMINIASIIAVIFSLTILIKAKNYNLQLSHEISYLNAKITEQQNYLKMFKSELAVVTSYTSLKAMYTTYYSESNIGTAPPQTAQIMGFKQFANVFGNSKISQAK